MIIVEVCVGSACHLKGAYNVINGLIKIIKDRELEDKVTIKAAFCLGNCTQGVSVKIDKDAALSCDENNINEFFEKTILARL